jgi:hypothetical protein
MIGHHFSASAFTSALGAGGLVSRGDISPASNKITYITDPWGTRIEIIERAPLGTPVN